MTALRLGVSIGYQGLRADRLVAEAQHAERLGLHSVWTGEAWGSDAVTPLAFAAAHTSTVKLGTSIMQIPGRTPAMTAMTAATLDKMSRGRMLLGLGVSGPQVVEGWHGQSFAHPLARTREYVEILRRAFSGAEPLAFDGDIYRLPYDGPDATGMGKPLRSSIKPRPDIPIYIAAIGPANVRQTVEIADGLLPVYMSSINWRAAFGDSLDGRDDTFEIAPAVRVVSGDDIGACRDKVRPLLGLYIGGMGSQSRNFYFDLVCRYGYEADAHRIQELYLGGHRTEAIAAVPDALIDELALVGPRAHIADQLDAWRDSPATLLILGPERREDVDLVAELV